MYLLRMPKADENMDSGTVSRWLVAEGAQVREGQDVVECIADKGDFTVHSEASGILRRIYAPEGSLVPVGYILAAIGQAEEPLPDVESENATLLKKTQEELTGKGAPVCPVPVATTLRATPAARKAAKELGVELKDVAAALKLAPDALIHEQDVKRFAENRSDKNAQGAGRPTDGGGA